MFWILTGDKKETAINIGLSTKVLEHSDTLLTLEAEENSQSILNQLKEMKAQITSSKQFSPTSTFCLVVTGETLTLVLGNQELSNALISVGT